MGEQDPALTPERVRAAILAAAARAGLEGLAEGTSRLAVAVSGGADSLALTLLAAESLPGRIIGVTVDHGLRPDSAAEAAQVARWLAGRNIPHVTLVWEGEKPAANIQAEARAARYRLLDGWCAREGVPAVLTAHHRDDVAETFLMRLSRGSGLAGLAAIPPARPLPGGTWVLRPLLETGKAQLRRALEARGQPWIEDPSNRNERFDRARVRRLLAEQPEPERLASRIAAAARHLAAANEAIVWVVERHLAAHITAAAGDPGALRIADRQAFLNVPDEILRRSLLACIERIGSSRSAPRGAELDRLADGLRRGEAATLGGALFRPRGAALLILPETGRR
ncbi:tRNA lysidine(34) synthetase TilS [Pedomonas sp. V897]|uniref:tRNA lysidine(34) synthetase TilS n=1 Tax=Pedomonas sp. V897 TaxID=3446482 RepID=UPI003EE14987